MYVYVCMYIYIYIPSGNLTQLWKITIFNGKFHYKWPFSIAMLVYQRVYHKSCILMEHPMIISQKTGLFHLFSSWTPAGTRVIDSRLQLLWHRWLGDLSFSPNPLWGIYWSTGILRNLEKISGKSKSTILGESSRNPASWEIHHVLYFFWAIIQDYGNSKIHHMNQPKWDHMRSINLPWEQ